MPSKPSATYAGPCKPWWAPEPPNSRHPIASAPAAEQPEPLFGIFPHPALDDGGDQPRGCGHVDLAGRIARQRYGIGDIETKLSPGHPHHAAAINRAIELPGQARQYGRRL